MEYHLRHHFTPCSGDVFLDGYDVLVYVKRMDYVVVDDKNFTTQLYPYSDGFPPESTGKRDASVDVEKTLGQLSDQEGSCVVSSVTSQARAGGLAALVEILTDMPSKAAAISPKKCDQQSRRADEKALKSLIARPMLLLHGFQVDHRHTRKILRCTHALESFREALYGLETADIDISSLLLGSTIRGGDVERLDLTRAKPFYLNDIEKDEMYSKYTSQWRDWAKVCRSASKSPPAFSDRIHRKAQ